MENISGFLKMTISILITLAIITSGLFLWYQTQPIVDLATSQAAAQAAELKEQEFSAFDNQLVSGSQILTAYRRYWNHENFFLYVRTYNGGTATEFGMNPSGTSSSCRAFNYSSGRFEDTGTSSCYIDEDDVTYYSGTYYVPPQARFQSTIIRDDNDRIAAIYFREQ
ncbi:hypothetical protein K0T92_10675 [Paenibacillus oenotherae]|uniref:Uncharacterized protein n=1 Tax=Paenibacillus oenotherae TaxID=1435645 RepID=A0ABS7D6N7_9BACL|nr:hypothetical protein [Paenibacillus oenotherae]MBW7475212.1 hypothetical protein [Paenibacillus oenotherae]